MRLVMWIAAAVCVALPIAGAAQKPAANPIVVFETVKGSFEVELFQADAPKSAATILALVNKRFYNGLRVHRRVSGFVVQFGDPTTRDMSRKALWGRQGSGIPVGAAEVKRPHRLGSVGFAHGGDPAEADSQIYITLSGQEEPNVANLQRLGTFAVIGQVVSGMDVVQKLQIPDVIRRATVKAPGPAAKK
jgi:cyclophilin family peptidyl-prolyl cis-trans isomerase